MSYIAMHQPWPFLTFGHSEVKPLSITVKKAVEKSVNSKIKKNMSYIAMNQPWPFLTFGPSVVKLLGTTVKKAGEKYLKRKIKKYVFCSIAPGIARPELWDQCS
jgi:hypothetical protein